MLHKGRFSWSTKKETHEFEDQKDTYVELGSAFAIVCVHTLLKIDYRSYGTLIYPLMHWHCNTHTVQCIIVCACVVVA